MQQAVFHRYGDVHVAAEFRCRGDDLLGIYADAIREQVESMRDLRRLRSRMDSTCSRIASA